MSPHREHKLGRFTIRLFGPGNLFLYAVAVLLIVVFAYSSQRQADQGKRSREALTLVFCNAHNHDQAVFRGIILAGADNAQKFAPLYRKYGVKLPKPGDKDSPQEIAQRIQDFDCQALTKRVEEVSDSSDKLKLLRNPPVKK